MSSTATFRTAALAAAFVGGLLLGAPAASAASLGDPAGVAAAAGTGVETVQYGYGYGYGPRYYRPRRFYAPPRPYYGPRVYGPRRYYGGPYRPGPYRGGPFPRDYR